MNYESWRQWNEENERARLMAKDLYLHLVNESARGRKVAPIDILQKDFNSMGFSIESKPLQSAEGGIYIHTTPWGNLKLDVNRQIAETPLPQPHEVELKERQTYFLERLMQTPLEVVSYGELAKIKPDKKNYLRPIDAVHSQVRLLRTAISHTKKTPLILTHHGVGYSLSSQK